MTVDEQLQILRRATTEIISEADLRKKLESGRKLRVKLGVDPTAKDVTLGWAVVLRKLRDFQRCGHQAVLVVGDFTAQIGDPSGKSKTRKQLTRDEVMTNVEAVLTQFGKILDLETLEIRYNSEWLGTMSFADVIRMTAKTTVARIMERDDFTKRWEAHQPISMHELMYPLCQATDSVALKADVELGGNDQKFNNLMGRQLQEAEGQEPQTVVLSPLLVGTDGKEKMSQSLGNYVSIQDTPNDMFGKTMSIPDDLIADVSAVPGDGLGGAEGRRRAWGERPEVQQPYGAAASGGGGEGDSRRAWGGVSFGFADRGVGDGEEQLGGARPNQAGRRLARRGEVLGSGGPGHEGRPGREDVARGQAPVREARLSHGRICLAFPGRAGSTD
ncbi:tyrosine--tRNA ligase [bacterium]|nr:MAG: tyrosine--tRNA ligase [bacterium]